MYKTSLHERLNDVENKLKRLNNGEYKVNNPEKIRTLLGYIILDCESKLFNLSI